MPKKAKQKIQGILLVDLVKPFDWYIKNQHPLGFETKEHVNINCQLIEGYY